MKTQYLKSIGLVLLGAILTLLLSNYFPKANADELVHEQVGLDNVSNRSVYNSSEDCTDESSNHVCLNAALENILEYRIWLKYVPKVMQYDTSINALTFDTVFINDIEDRTLINQMLDYFWEHNGHFEYPNLPAHGVKDYAYFISKKDIVQAFNVFEPGNKSDTANGIRVYIASEGLKLHDVEATQTHIYVVPTYMAEEGQSNDSIPEINGEKYVLDLTTPCPAYCDGKSPLNLSSL